MKILFIAPEYPPFNIGGGGVVVRNLVRVLSKLGCKITVAAGFYPVRSIFEKAKCHDSDPRIVLLPLFPTPKTPFQLKTVMPPNIFSFLHLIKVLAGNYDVIHLHGFGHGLIDIAAILCLFVKQKRYILTLHGFPHSPLESGGIMGFLYRAYLSTFGKFLLRKADRVIAVSQSIKDESISLGLEPERVVVIPNGVDLISYSSYMSSASITQKLGTYKDDFLLVAVGILHVRKGFQFLIMALPSILKCHPEARVIIVGRDGGYGENLKKLSEELGVVEKVSFTGFLDSDSKRRFMNMADVFVIPSLVEPFGLVALEAMACGKPIVATEVEGLGEILENERTALLIKPGNGEQLAGAIIRLIDEAKLRLRLSKSAEKEVRGYDWSLIGEGYFRLYSNLVAQAKD